ncbi:SDR family oxidoreductase [Halorussus halophilus]|uniref:SDR family oxidoreductase n=1 Tax=Halorussus halophilus TaxID=2650975 RepID=UPI0013015DE5|nr:SDR family oxidoreductase [Halorussus halophilus]
MSATFEYADQTVLVTGASGALGSAVCQTFADTGATVAATDVVEPDDDSAALDPAASERIHFYQGDFTDESEVERVVSEVADDHGGIDALVNVAGTWKGGSPIEDTDVDTFDLLLDVNLKTMFLASKHALPHLKERDGQQGAIVSVSARASLEGGEGDGPYRASKAGVRLLTETIAEENEGVVRANAVMPSVIDTPANREMMPDADHETWVAPEDIAEVMLFLCSESASVTSGAAVPVYGEA